VHTVPPPPAPPPPRVPAAQRQVFGEGIEESALATTPQARTRDTEEPPDARQSNAEIAGEHLVSEDSFESSQTQAAYTSDDVTSPRTEDTQPTRVATPGDREERQEATVIHERKRGSS
jgi:hypothetical protein